MRRDGFRVRLPVLSAGSDLGWRTDGVGLWHCSHYHQLQSCPTWQLTPVSTTPVTKSAAAQTGSLTKLYLIDTSTTQTGRNTLKAALPALTIDY